LWICLALSRILLLIALKEEFGLCLFERRPRLQARNGQQITRAVSYLLRGKNAYLKNTRPPDLYSTDGKLKTRRQDANDCVVLPVEGKRLSDELWIRCKPALPQAVTDDYYLIATGLILAR